VDYILSFADSGEVIATLMGEYTDGTELKVSATAIDPEAVTYADVIGGTDINTGAETGMEVIRQVYPLLGMTSGLLLAPGWSQNANVAAALQAKCEKINGVFSCECVLDVDCSESGAMKYTDVKTVKEKSGINIEVISGKTEAYYSFLGAKGSASVKGGISVDLGGGSTEILSFRKTKVFSSTSLPFGCLTLYEMFFENGKFDMEGCRAYIKKHLKKYAPRCFGQSLLLSGGSAKAILRYKNILDNKKNFTLQKDHFTKVENHFLEGDEREKKKIEEVLKDRFRLVPPAIAVFSEIASFYRKEQVLVCKSGVREGCLWYHLNKK
jgi:hypothetical protein